MLTNFDPNKLTEHYKEHLDLLTNEAIVLEMQIKESTDAAEIKKLFVRFIGTHRQMIIAEFAWVEALQRDMEPKDETVVKHKRFRRK